MADGPVALKAGDVLRLAQAGGGGYGDPRTRPIADVVSDVREGYVSTGAARDAYGVAVIAADGDWQVDLGETAYLRQVINPLRGLAVKTNGHTIRSLTIER